MSTASLGVEVLWHGLPHEHDEHGDRLHDSTSPLSGPSDGRLKSSAGHFTECGVGRPGVSQGLKWIEAMSIRLVDIWIL